MNGTRDKGCKLIDDKNHWHVFELLDTVKFFTEWKNENDADDTKTKYNFLPMSTYEDTVWTAIGMVGVARKQLKGEHNLVTRRGGSDICKELFCAKHNKNTNADALNTDQIMARNQHCCLMNMSASCKANFGKRKTYFGRKLNVGKIKRIQGKRQDSKSIIR